MIVSRSPRSNLPVSSPLYGVPVPGCRCCLPGSAGRMRAQNLLLEGAERIALRPVWKAPGHEPPEQHAQRINIGRGSNIDCP